MRRLAAAAAALVLSGCAGSGAPPRDPAPAPDAPPPARAATDAELLQQRLDARARVPAEARRLGVRALSLRLEDVRIAGDRARLRVRLAYRVRGVRGRFGGVRAMRARRGQDGWRVAGAVPARGRAPWEADAYERASTRRFVVWMPAGLDPAPLLPALEAGYARMRGTLRRGRLRDRYLVVVARDAGRARRLTGSIRGLDGLTALTDTEVRQVGEAERVAGVASQRLLVVWPNFVALDPESQRMTVAHELTHAALAPVTSGRTPAWLTEGVALYVSGDRRSAEAAELLAARVGSMSLRELSRPDAIGRLRGDEQRLAYAYASAAAFHVAERHGRDRLLRLYDVFNRETLRGPAGDPAVVDAATRRVLRTSLTGLDRDLRASLDPF